jgi:hypothetical protein
VDCRVPGDEDGLAPDRDVTIGRLTIRRLALGVLAAAISVASGAVSSPAALALGSGCEARVTPEQGPVGTLFTVSITGSEPKPHGVSLEHMGLPVSFRPVKSTFPYPSSFRYSFQSAPGDEGTWKTRGVGLNCHATTFHVGAPEQWCYIKATRSWGDRVRVSGSYFVDSTDITVTFSQPVTDWTVRPRPTITSKVFGSGLSWFSVEVRPQSASPSTLEVAATNGSCAVSSSFAVGAGQELPSTDAGGQAAQLAPIKLQITAMLAASAIFGAAVWNWRRRKPQGA